jgi:hypothetical protein
MGATRSPEKRGTLIDMRSAAILLLVTLVGPSIATVVCDATCVQHRPQSGQAMSLQPCHEEQSPNDGPVMTSAAAASCHDDPESFTATAATDSRILEAASLNAQLPRALSFSLPQSCDLGRSTGTGPPGIVLHTAPLRI